MDAQKIKVLLSSVEKIGNAIIKCREKCLGMRNDPSENHYPRGLFLENDNSEADVAVVGLNPGNAGCLEREFYKFVAEQNAEGRVTYQDSVRISRAISKDHKYYEWPRFFLGELGINPANILWAEIAFCERGSNCTTKQFKDALDACSRQYLVSILRLLPEGAHVMCLGRRAYHRIYKLTHVNGEWRNEWKDAGLRIIGAYHPSGSRLFGRYFRGKGKITERELQEGIRHDFKKLQRRRSYSEFWDQF